METIIVGFIIIVIVGALFGGESFGGVIVTGIIVLIIGAFILGGINEYNKSKKEEEYKREQRIIEREAKLKEEMVEKLSVEEKKSTDSNYLYFHNKCDKKVTLNIHYLNTSGEWETDGEWNFEANEASYLKSSDGRLRTNNSILFYSVEGEGIHFNGDYKFKKYGETYNMKKISDNYDDTEWSFSCD